MIFIPVKDSSLYHRANKNNIRRRITKWLSKEN